MIELNSNINCGGQFNNNTTNNCPPSIITQSKGLLNMPGQNNCFLNSAVQVLWHLNVFRNSIDLFSGHYCTSATTACVFCSLSQLFSQLKNSTRNALNADHLRIALAHTFSAQRRFQLGLMDDAIECFEHILQRLHFHCVHNQIKEEECNAFHCLSHALFSMRLTEKRFCTNCGRVESTTPYNQYVQYVSTSGLIEKSNYNLNNNLNKLSFGSMIRLVSMYGEVTDCSVITCKSRVQTRKTLLNAPKVLAIGLNYENERQSIDQIADVFKIVDTFIRLSDVFEIDAQNLRLNSVDSNCDILHLVGLVTYYGKHYCTFFYNTQLQTWLYLDDANVKELGNSWLFVVDKCKQSHFLPLMLLYASSNESNSINTSQAPKAVYQVPSNLKSLIMKQQQQQQQQIQQDNLNNRRSTSHLPHIILNNNNINNCVPTKSSIINNQFNEDIPPDSPFAKSSTTSSSAYFSDYCTNENEVQYISKRTVQNIIHAQKFAPNTNTCQPNNNHFQNANPQRNSSSSFSDSFPTTNDQQEDENDYGNNNGNNNNLIQNNKLKNHQQPPILPVKPNIYQNNNNNNNAIRPFRKELKSADAGYDSYSLSSSDSYPSIGGSAVSNSTTNGSTSSSGCSSQNSNERNSLNTNKTTLRSIKEQIGEQLIDSNNSILDSKLLELINNDNQTQDSDKLITRLCSESDILLLRSHEKERENDLKAAAALSESAAQMARAAMDVPLNNESNSHLLISAKMKHNMAVMRSALLISRIKEIEQEEKKCKNLLRLSRESLHQINHQRTHSLSSSHLSSNSSNQNSHHQRRASQERLDENLKKQTRNNKPIRSTSTAQLQLYGTLPKKQQQQQKPIVQLNDSHTNNSKQSIKQQSSVNQPVPPQQKILNQIPINLSEQSVVSKNKNKINNKNQLNRNASSCSTNSIKSTTSTKDSKAAEYAEISDLKKQHKIRKKLLIGNFIKRKNKSLSDLRDGDGNQQSNIDTTITSKEANNQISQTSSNQSNNKTVDEVDSCLVANQNKDKLPVEVKKTQPATPDKQIAKVSRKGFHPQSIYENQKSLNIDLTAKLNQQIIVPKVAAKPINITKNKPIDEVDNKQMIMLNKKMELKKLDLPPVNAEIKSKTIDETVEIDLDSLPPPPEEFLSDLRQKKLQLNKEQFNNQINENIDNEIKEKNILANTGNNDNRKTAVLNLANKFEQQINIKKSISSSIITNNKPPLPPFNNNINQVKKFLSTSSILPHGDELLKQQQQQHQQNAIYNNLKNLNISLNNKINQQQQQQQQPINNKLSNSTNSSTGLRVALLSSRNQPSPTLIYKNSLRSSPTIIQNDQQQQATQFIRPNKPPDYDTTIKRLNSLQNTNKSIDSNYGNLLSSLPSSLNSSLDSPFKNNQSQNGVQLPPQQIVALKQQQYNKASAIRNKRTTKKSVSFSDSIVVVEHPDDKEDECHYRNPILDKVLKKNNLSIS